MPTELLTKNNILGKTGDWICPFRGKKASQNSMRRKDDIVGNNWTGCYNKEGKGKTREQEKRSI